MRKSRIKNEHYSNLKMIIRIITLGIAIWGLIVAYQAKSLAEWVNNKQENVIEMLIFNKK